jgi:hypothetical protein
MKEERISTMAAGPLPPISLDIAIHMISQFLPHITLGYCKHRTGWFNNLSILTIVKYRTSWILSFISLEYCNGEN